MIPRSAVGKSTSTKRMRSSRSTGDLSSTPSHAPTAFRALSVETILIRYPVGTSL